MKIAAIIAEYNPFHNGHAYQIAEARRRTNADYIAVLMSGDFVQRGEPAIVDKFTRAKMALSCGADLVLELPVRYACASAESFASGAVSILHALGCVDVLCFGAETTGLLALQELAAVLCREPENYRTALKTALASGLSFPAARAEALRQTVPSLDISLLSSPNNILAVEYLKALHRLSSGIAPVLIPRIGNGYHEDALSSAYASATAIRQEILRSFEGNGASSGNVNASCHQLTLADCIPAPALDLLSDALTSGTPVCANDFSSMLHYRLLTSKRWETFSACTDVPEDLARRIFRLRDSFTDVESFVESVKTKNITNLAVRRALMHILLQLRQTDASAKVLTTPAYARVLGFRRSASEVLREIKKQARLPLITKFADAPEILEHFAFYTKEERAAALHSFRETQLATQLYHSVLTSKNGDAAFVEQQTPPVIL